jgi:hypothetical protein
VTQRARTLWVLAAAVLACGLVLGWFCYGPRRTPEGQPALAQLDAASLATFRETFNAGAGELRLLALFSPT